MKYRFFDYFGGWYCGEINSSELIEVGNYIKIDNNINEVMGVQINAKESCIDLIVAVDEVIDFIGETR